MKSVLKVSGTYVTNLLKTGTPRARRELAEYHLFHNAVLKARAPNDQLVFVYELLQSSEEQAEGLSFKSIQVQPGSTMRLKYSD